MTTKSTITILFSGMLFLPNAATVVTFNADSAAGDATGAYANQWTWSALAVSAADACKANGDGDTAKIGSRDQRLNVNIANAGYSNGINFSLTLSINAKTASGSSAGFEMAAYYGGAEQLENGGTVAHIAADGNYHTYSWAGVPVPGGGSWDWTKINAMTAGCYSRKSNASGQNFYVENVQVSVSFDAAPELYGVVNSGNLDGDSYQRAGTGANDSVVVNYRLYDGDLSNDTIKADYWDPTGAGSWNAVDPTKVRGDFTVVSATSSGTTRSFRWAAGAQLPATKEWSTSNIRVIAKDATSLLDTIQRSLNNLKIDTKPPTPLPDCSAPLNHSDWPGPNATLTSSASGDGNAFYYGFDLDTVNSNFNGAAHQSSSLQTGTSWVTTNGLDTSGYFHWRVMAQDTFGNATAYSDPDTFKVSSYRPSLIIDSARQTSTDGSGKVTAYWRINDPQNKTCKIKIWYSPDNSNWYTALLLNPSVGSLDNAGVYNHLTTGQITGITLPSAGGKTFEWHTDSTGANGNEPPAVTGYDGSVWIKGTAINADGWSGDTVKSSSFAVDNAVPTGANDSLPADASPNWPVATTLVSKIATDNSQFYYQIQRDSLNNSFNSDTLSSSLLSSNTWSVTLSGGKTYYWRSRARDIWGNTAAWGASVYRFTTTSGWTYPTGAGVIKDFSASPAMGDGYVYFAAHDTVYCVDALSGIKQWQYRNASSGADYVNSLYADNQSGQWIVYGTTDGNAQQPQIFAINSAGTQIFALQIGTNKSVLSEPIVDPAGSYIYFAYNGKGEKRLIGTGASAGGNWPVGITNLSVVGAPVVDGASIWFGLTNGNITRVTLDGSTLSTSTFGTAAVNNPLGMWLGRLYVTNGATIYNVNASNLTSYVGPWSYAATVSTGVMRAFPIGQSASYNFAFVGTGNTMRKISLADGSTISSYAPSGVTTLSSMPIANVAATKIFFGTDKDSAFCLDVTSAPTMTRINGWPKFMATGATCTTTPALDEGRAIVVFCATLSGGTTGRVYAFVTP